MIFLRVKNWERFQHYRDRNPLWIKLHTSLLSDYAFCVLPDAEKCALLHIWLLASADDGRVPHDPKYIRDRCGLGKTPNLTALVDAGFLVFDDGKNEPAEKWASRYISAEARALLLKSAGNKCQSCGAAEQLEVDHIIPVSRGGTGDISNLQILCRSCNRSKRARSAPAEQLATQLSDEGVALALSREEEKRQRREEQEKAAGAFARFWEAYPRKVAKPAALKAWRRLSPSDELFAKVMAALRAQAATWTEPQFIPYPASWLNGRRFDDEVSRGTTGAHVVKSPISSGCDYCGKPSAGMVNRISSCNAHWHDAMDNKPRPTTVVTEGD